MIPKIFHAFIIMFIGVFSTWIKRKLNSIAPGSLVKRASIHHDFAYGKPKQTNKKKTYWYRKPTGSGQSRHLHCGNWKICEIKRSRKLKKKIHTKNRNQSQLPMWSIKLLLFVLQWNGIRFNSHGLLIFICFDSMNKIRFHNCLMYAQLCATERKNVEKILFIVVVSLLKDQHWIRRR